MGAQDAAAVAELAATRKTAKYTALESRYIFQPIAVETRGPINGSAVSFTSSVVLVDGLPMSQVKLVKAAFFSSG